MPPPVGIDDDLGDFPAELLGQLEAHRLLPLGSVGLLQGGEVEPALLGGALPDPGAAVVDQPADEDHLGAVDVRLLLVQLRRIDRHVDVGLQSGPGGVGGERAPGIPRGRKRDLPRAELQCTGHGRGQAPCLEGAGGVGALVLEEQPLQPHPCAQPRHGKQGGVPLAERDDMPRLPDREQLAPAPHPAGAGGDGLAGQGAGRPLQVVAGEEDLAAIRAERLETVGVVLAPAGAALEVGQRADGLDGGGGHGHHLPGSFIAAEIDRTTDRGPSRTLNASILFFHPWMTNGFPASIAW